MPIIAEKNEIEQPEKKEIGQMESPEITSFSFSHSGMSTDLCYSYSVTQKTDGVQLYAELNAGRSVVDTVIDESVLEELGKIAQKYHLSKWNGFQKTNNMVLDGENFSLSITLADGSSISASGNNAFPDDYADASSEIQTLFSGLIDEYGDLYPKTLESDELKHVTFSLSAFGGKKFFFSGITRDGTVSLDIRIKGYEEFYPQEEYNFFGSCDYFPFDDIQSVVRKYDIPSWNGWDKAAENYNECEWFQLDFGYDSGESISAMGTLHPDDYDDARKEIILIITDYIEEYGDSFVPWKG